MRSLTKFGLSQITLQFTDNTDIYRARQLVAERLQTAMENLPKGTSPKLAPISTGLGEIFYYSVSYRTDAKLKPATELDANGELPITKPSSTPTTMAMPKPTMVTQ